MINITIVDDNMHYISEIEILLEKYEKLPQHTIRKYTDENIFISDLKNGMQHDIVFLDIMLKTASGIDVGEMINEMCPKTKIIFISANSGFFKDVYNTEHEYFLTKPFEPIRFSNAIKKVLASLGGNFIVLPLRAGKRRIELNDILFFENYLRSTKIYFANGDILEIPIKLTELEQLLPQNIFIRTHKSFIVNIEKHICAERLKIYMPLNITVPISKSYSNEVRDRITMYLGGMI